LENKGQRRGKGWIGRSFYMEETESFGKETGTTRRKKALRGLKPREMDEKSLAQERASCKKDPTNEEQEPNTVRKEFRGYNYIGIV